MPQLNPSPWFFTLIITWTSMLTILLLLHHFYYYKQSITKATHYTQPHWHWTWP